MTRIDALRSVLDRVVSLHPLEATEFCETQLAAQGDAFLLSLLSFSLCFAQDFEKASDAAARALAESVDSEAAILALAATAWAGTCWASPYEGDAIEEGLGRLHELDDSPADLRAFTLYLLAESALGSARIDTAARAVEASGALPSGFLADADGAAHPYLAMMQVMRVRLLGFQGRVSEALQVLDSVSTPPGSSVDLLSTATRCLLVGNNAQRQAVRAIADRLERELGEPDDYISAGCYILVSYGLIATAEIARAAQFVIAAGRTAGLEGLNFIDRALGFEMLVAAAVAESDLDAAQAWQLQAQPLLSQQISRPTVERINSRVALLAGDAAGAAAWGERAIEHAAADGRAIELAEGEIVLSRARIALSERGAASARLGAMAARAATSGHLAAQKSAARELRRIGRRLRPAAGSGWEGLSSRERDVALLVAEGFGNNAIAAELHLSEHTVQAHVSRVLAAFGAASRLSVAAQLTRMLPPDSPSAPPPALTPRQAAVAAQVAAGLTNEAIAHELGVSVKTVEKHVSEILRRWQVASRIGIARRALSVAEAGPGATEEPSTHGHPARPYVAS
jgi:DNA-binding NarL/FixJ family response regulator